MLTNQKRSVIILLLFRCYMFRLFTYNNSDMEEYPSLVEGTGLENREVGQLARGFESLFLRHLIFYITSRDGAVW